jgi:hypothetical protein
MMNEYPNHRTDVNVRIVDGELVVLDRHKGLIHQLNQTASYIWERCDGRSTAADIAKQLVKEFGVSVETAEADAQGFVEQLHALDLLI